MSEFKRVERALDCMLITVVVTRRVEHSHWMRLCDAIVASAKTLLCVLDRNLP